MNAVAHTYTHTWPIGFGRTRQCRYFHQQSAFNAVLSKSRREVDLHTGCDCGTQVGVALRAAVHLSSVLVRETVFWMSAHGHLSAPVAQKVNIICCLAVYIAWGSAVAKAVAKAANNSGRQV